MASNIVGGLRLFGAMGRCVRQSLFDPAAVEIFRSGQVDGDSRYVMVNQTRMRVANDNLPDAIGDIERALKSGAKAQAVPA